MSLPTTPFNDSERDALQKNLEILDKRLRELISSETSATRFVGAEYEEAIQSTLLSILISRETDEIEEVLRKNLRRERNGRLRFLKKPATSKFEE